MSSYAITYGTLKNQVLTLIKNTVKNIDSMNNVPATLKVASGGTVKDLRTVASGSWTAAGNGLRLFLLVQICLNSIPQHN